MKAEQAEVNDLRIKIAAVFGVDGRSIPAAHVLDPLLLNALAEAREQGERRGEAALERIRAMWPHIELADGPRSYDKSRVRDPGAPTCLRCKIEDAIAGRGPMEE